MTISKLLSRYAAWGLALGVMVACGTQDNTPPSSYGYPLENGGTSAPAPTNAAGAGPSSSGAAAVDPTSASSASGGPSSSGSSGGNTAAGSCPMKCATNADCASCPLTGGKNCCVMQICAMMAACPVIRDSGRDGS
jgi:hypothetical protein